MGKSSPPPPPDYTAAAKETAAGNLDAARAATAANRVNQITPQGTLNYEITGEDPFGNPTWTATQQYSPGQQAIYDKNLALSTGLLGTAEQGLGSVNQMLADPTIDKSTLPTMPINAGQSYTDAALNVLQPQWEREQAQLETRLANQGITMGSEAYNNEMERLARQRGIQQSQLAMGSVDKGMSAYQQALQNQQYEKMMPLNIINALRTGNQVQGPNYVQSAQQATTAGADLLGAANAQYQGQLQGYNAQQAAQGEMIGGLLNFGAAALPVFL